MKEFKVGLSAARHGGAAAGQKRGVAALAAALGGDDDALKAYRRRKLRCLRALGNAAAKQVRSSNHAPRMLTPIDWR
jgi:hypothetical protein